METGSITNGSFTVNSSLWGIPSLVDTIEKSDRVEFVYKQTQMITLAMWPPPPPEVRVFKIVFSCIDGKWNKSEPIYGNIIPATEETYEF